MAFQVGKQNNRGHLCGGRTTWGRTSLPTAPGSCPRRRAVCGLWVSSAPSCPGPNPRPGVSLPRGYWASGNGTHICQATRRGVSCIAWLHDRRSGPSCFQCHVNVHSMTLTRRRQPSTQDTGTCPGRQDPAAPAPSSRIQWAPIPPQPCDGRGYDSHSRPGRPRLEGGGLLRVDWGPVSGGTPPPPRGARSAPFL